MSYRFDFLFIDVSYRFGVLLIDTDFICRLSISNRLTKLFIDIATFLFERSEFLIATSKKKKLTVCVDVCGCTANLGFSEEKLSWF